MKQEGAFLFLLRRVSPLLENFSEVAVPMCDVRGSSESTRFWEMRVPISKR